MHNETTRRGVCRLVAGLLLLLALVGDGRSAAVAGDETISPREWALIKRAEQARIKLVQRVRPTVVAVFGNNRRGGGSGVLFHPAGLALTNHHVVAAAGTEGFAGLDDGKLYRWKLVGTDPGGDVAVIRLTGKDRFPFAPLGLSDAVKPGDWVLAAGNPFTLAEDYKPTVTLGIVSGVKRYQHGSGRNLLVYGNCIQVDSSINPGNSGGPLFNLRGEVIGINGRASFKERGRVNVGAGYAISMRQIRNFLPELLATKIARHGTLDAQFGDRSGGVICEAINLDSPAAKAGLQLGDKLLRFDGEPVRNANQFTNLISMLPEGWPVELVVERNGKQRTVRVRLDPLNYGAAPKKKPKPKKGAPKIVIRTPRLKLENAGLVRDAAVNREMCRLVLQQWRRNAGMEKPPTKPRVFQFEDVISRNGKKVGTQELTIAGDGRFRIVLTLDGKRRVFESPGLNAAENKKDKPSDGKATTAAELIANPFSLQAAVLSGMIGAKPLSPLFSAAAIDGGDKSQGERGYRLSLSPNEKEARTAYLWLSQFDKSGRDDVRLLKTGIHTDGDRARPAMTYTQWTDVGGVKLPFRRTVVVGLAETPMLEIRTISCRPLTEWPILRGQKD